MTAFVLGNGISRLAVAPALLQSRGTVYGCNAIYKEFTPNVLIATDSQISRDIQESGYSKEHRFYTRRPINGLGALVVPKPYFGFSSGPNAVAIAAMSHHDPIYLLGFDMGPNETGQFNNVYAGALHYKPVGSSPTYTGNWVKQLVKIMQDFTNQQFIRVVGSTTAKITELEQLKNLNHMYTADFLVQINTLKEI